MQTRRTALSSSPDGVRAASVIRAWCVRVVVTVLMGLLQGHVLARAASGECYRSGTVVPWPSGRIPFVLDPTLDKSVGDLVRQAINQWQTALGGVVTFIECRTISGSKSAVACPDPAPKRAVNFVRFTPVTDRCQAPVGYLQGEQNVWLASQCDLGAILHELGHLLGLQHEMARLDRQQYIDVHLTYMETIGQCQFEPADSIAFRLAYDFRSIMHYPQTTRPCSAGEVCIMKKEHENDAMYGIQSPEGFNRLRDQHLLQSEIGDIGTISDGDAQKIKLIYGHL